MCNNKPIGLVDIHSHILPGVDDGAANVKEALAMLKLEEEQGVTDVILTPHNDESPNKLALVYADLLKAVLDAGININIHLGMEYYVPCGIFTSSSAKKSVRMSESKYLLAEFSPRTTIDDITKAVKNIRNQGFEVIIAHPERYRNITIDDIRQLSEEGIKIQVNAPALAGLGGETELSKATAIAKAGLMDYMGSDAHGIRRRMPAIGAGYKALVNLLGEAEADRICKINPRELLGKSDR